MDRTDLCECGHPRLDEDEGHRNGTRGCRVPGCGCARFQLAAATTPEPVDLAPVVDAVAPAADAAPVEEPPVDAVPAPAAPTTHPAAAALSVQLDEVRALLAQADRNHLDARSDADQAQSDLATQTNKLAAARRERDHAQRLVTDAWEALATPGAGNLSGGIINLRRDRDALVTETGELRDRLTAALDRADTADARIRELEAGGVDLLMLRAEGYDLARVASAVAGLRGAVDIVRSVLDTADVELQIRGEISDLETQLDAKRLRLQALAGTADHTGDPVEKDQPPWWPLPAAARVIRAWCRDNRVEVNSVGTPNRAAVDAYVAAHPAAARA